MRKQRAERLRFAVNSLPPETRRAMLDGIERNRIVTGANTDRRGGVCPMLAADRESFNVTPLAEIFATAWDRYTGTGGAITLSAPVGAATRLLSLFASGKVLNLNGGVVKTTGDQDYLLPVVLNAAANFTALTADNVSFTSTVRSLVDGVQSLNVSAGGNVTFGGAVGDNGQRLANLNVTAGSAGRPGVPLAWAITRRVPVSSRSSSRCLAFAKVLIGRIACVCIGENLPAARQILCEAQRLLGEPAPRGRRIHQDVGSEDRYGVGRLVGDALGDGRLTRYGACQAGELGRQHRRRGGGCGGVYTAMELEKLYKNDPQVEIGLVAKDNYLVFQPMLPEVISGSIGILDVITPIRRLPSDV